MFGVYANRHLMRAQRAEDFSDGILIAIGRIAQGK
jgi:hypothetical protein